jgi:hypothetical protein
LFLFPKYSKLLCSTHTKYNEGISLIMCIHCILNKRMKT